MIPRLIKEPFVHFVAIGALLFGLYQFRENLRPAETGAAEGLIVIDQQEFDHLKELWKIRWKRDPSPSDIQALLDRHLRQEVFYREALRMNLDHNDEIIKKRLSQKMEAVANDLSTLTQPPTDERLKAFFHDHADFFKLPRAYELRQVLFLANEADVEARMKETLAALRDGGEIPPDRNSKAALANDWPLTSVHDLDNGFGGDFTRSLEELPSGEWSGPIRSGYGWHLVFITTKQEPMLPDFAAVRDYVAREYDYRSEMESQDRVFRELLAKYQVSITANDVPANIKSNFVSP
jgi:peptidyl-prolyl cis-trans isomerase C